MDIFKALFGGKSVKEKIYKTKIVAPANDVKCPNCNTALLEVPKSKILCPFCKKYIYVRTHYETRKVMYLTEKEKNSFDKDKANHFFYRDWFRKIKDIGITDIDIEEVRSKLRSKWGEGHPSSQDLLWALFNRQVTVLAKRKAACHEFKMLYYTWALFSYEIDADPTNLLMQSHKWELLGYKSVGITKVQILATGCEDCNRLNGKVLSIEDAMKNGFLPNKFCTNKLIKNGNKFAWCRCIYLSWTEELSHRRKHFDQSIGTHVNKKV